MNWKLIALLLVLSLAIWAPSLPADDAPAGCPCCKEMSKDGTDCCKDGKCGDCCKDCAGCKDGKCGECCKDGSCKDGKCACCGKADDKTAKKGCCGGKMCNRHAHGSHSK